MNKTDKLIMTTEQLAAVDEVLEILKSECGISINTIYSVKKVNEFDHHHTGEHLCEVVDYYPISIKTDRDLHARYDADDYQPLLQFSSNVNLEVHEKFYATLLRAVSESKQYGKSSLINFVKTYFAPLKTIVNNYPRLRQVVAIELTGKIGLNERFKTASIGDIETNAYLDRGEKICFLADLAAQYFLINTVYYKKPVVVEDFIPQLYGMLPMLLSYEMSNIKRTIDMLTAPAVDCGSITARPLAYHMYVKCCSNGKGNIGAPISDKAFTNIINKVGVSSREGIRKLARSMENTNHIVESMMGGSGLNLLELRRRFDIALITKDSMMNDAAKKDLIDELYDVLNRVNVYSKDSKVSSKDRTALDNLENDINLVLEEVREINVKRRRYSVNLTQEIPKGYRG